MIVFLLDKGIDRYRYVVVDSMSSEVIKSWSRLMGVQFASKGRKKPALMEKRTVCERMRRSIWEMSRNFNCLQVYAWGNKVRYLLEYS